MLELQCRKITQLFFEFLSSQVVLSVATLVVSGVIADEQPAKEDKKAIEPAAAEPAVEASKKQDKRGLEYDFGGHDFGGDHGHHHFDHHEEKTLTIIKKIPVPYKVEKTVHVPVERIVKYPVHVHVPAPYPVEKVILVMIFPRIFLI